MAGARGPRARHPLAAARRARLARAPLRSRDQLRARHPQQPARCRGRRAAWTAGYRSGGGGALLDSRSITTPRAHTTDNARRAASHDAVVGRDGATRAGCRLDAAPTSRAAAHASGARLLGVAHGPLVGIHVSGGRAIKQWTRTGSPTSRARSIDDRRRHDRADRTRDRSRAGRRREARAAARQRRSIRRATSTCSTLAAVLERLDLLVTGDTGPMHLAIAVGTPVVAVFGPSDPARYAPRGPRDRVVRIDLPCSPCNRIRLPPARCVGPHAGLPRLGQCRQRIRRRNVGDSPSRAKPRCHSTRRPHDRRATRRIEPARPCRAPGAARDIWTAADPRRARQHMPGSRRCDTSRRRTAAPRAGSRSAAIRSGGSPSCTCTSSRRSWTRSDDRRNRALVERERPSEMSIDGGHRLLRGLAGQVAARPRIPCRNAPGFGGSRVRLFRMDWRARGLTLAATASRARRKAAAFATASRGRRLAFVHRAFWRGRIRRQRGVVYRPSPRRPSKRRRASPAHMSASARAHTSARAGGGIRLGPQARPRAPHSDLITGPLFPPYATLWGMGVSTCPCARCTCTVGRGGVCSM